MTDATRSAAAVQSMAVRVIIAAALIGGMCLFALV
jgi:hypothetical protein